MFRAECGNNLLYQIISYSIRGIISPYSFTISEEKNADIARQVRNAYEKKHRALRQRQKRAIDVMLDLTDVFLAWPDDQPLLKKALWQQVEECKVHSSRQDLQKFKRLEERGYGDLLLHRYPSLRK